MERASRRKRQRALNGAKASTTLVGDLIAAANGRLSLTKPRNSPRETDGRTEVVVVVRIDGRVLIRRIRANELHSGVGRALARIHPAREVAAGNAECRVSSANRRHCQSGVHIGNTDVIPSNAEVQREVFAVFVIVLRESTEFILNNLRHDVRTGSVIRPRGQVLGVADVVKVRDVAQRTRIVVCQASRNSSTGAQQIGHRRIRTRDIRRACSLLSRGSVRTADRRGGDIVIREETARALLGLAGAHAQFTAELDGVSAVGPTQCIGVRIGWGCVDGVSRDRGSDTAETVGAALRRPDAAMGIAEILRLNLRNYSEAIDLRGQELVHLCLVFRNIPRSNDIRSLPPHAEPRFIEKR